jgi:murein L,D-transpeptidase YcbB/YkuD
MQIRLPILATFLAFATIAPAWSDSPATDSPAQQIGAVLENAAITDAAADPQGAADLRRFYERRNDAPAWGDPAAVAALGAALAGASDQGLPSARFALPAANADGVAAADVALTRVALRYASALARGRVEPAKIESDWAIPAPGFDAAAGLAGALAHDLGAWYAGLAPHHAAYQRLVAALARYRGNSGWEPIPRGEPLKLGMTDARVRALRRRLEAEGDLVPSAPPPAPGPQAPVADAGPIQRVAAVSGDAVPAAAAVDPDIVFDDAVEAAVRRFQRRFGIAVDGAVGPRTLVAMNVPLKARVAQMALNLERWRALPHDLGTSYMLVNVPAETLEVVQDGVPVIGMKVVVGDVDHPTPVVRTQILALTFNPTWTIPASIVTKEILPKSKANHSYLAKNEIVFAPGHGWQQLPGPKNPLGQLKFETPNQFDVYLHDTPSKLAFDRFFRAQSHGCVRLENAEELAGFVMRNAGWNELQLSQAVASGESGHVEVRPRWRVWLLYDTAFADADGTVEFRDDLYGRDARLEDALKGEREAERQAQL